MKTISLNFKLHIPLKLKHYPFYKIGSDHTYIDENEYRSRIDNLCDNIYDELLDTLLRLSKQHNTNFRFGFQITGSSLLLLEKYRPSTFELLNKVINSASCELISGTFSNSLSSIIDKDAFKYQVEAQNRLIYKMFGKRCHSFINCEQIYDDSIGKIVSDLGQSVIIADLSDNVKNKHSDNFLYSSVHKSKLKLLAYNKSLSLKTSDYFFKDDSNFKNIFDKISNPNADGNILTLIIDCDRKLKNNNFEKFINHVIESHYLEFMTPHECACEYDHKAVVSINDMGIKSINFNISPLSMEAMRIIHSPELIQSCCDKELQLLLLQSSDLFNIIFHKPLSDGGNGSEESHMQHFINYMNVVSDLSDKKFC